jgi:hypothetical protein
MKKPEELKGKEKKDKSKYALAKFKLSIDMLKFEATVLWQIFTTYLLANTIILGFLTSGLFEDAPKTTSFILLITGSIVGLIITTLWFKTYNINSDWYYFRMNEQAKLDETIFVESIKDNNWFLLNKAAERFATNQSSIKNKHSGKILIITFFICYLSIIVYSVLNIYCNF